MSYSTTETLLPYASSSAPKSTRYVPTMDMSIPAYRPPGVFGLWKGAVLGVTGSQSALPGLMDISSGALMFHQDYGRFHFSAVGMANKYCITAGSGQSVTVTKYPDPIVTCHDGVRTICDCHRFLTRDIFLRKNSQKVCLLRKYSYLCGVVRHYVKLKNFRLWETQNSKKLKIVLNFQDCLVVSNFLSTFFFFYET